MDPSEGNLLLAEVCEDVHRLHAKTEKLKLIWKTVLDTNMDLNNKLENLQKKISNLQQQVNSLQDENSALEKKLNQIKGRETELKDEVRDLQQQLSQMGDRNTELENRVSELQEQVGELQKKTEVPTDLLPRLKMRKFLSQIEALMYRRIFPDACETYRLEDLKNRLTTKDLNRQYDKMIAELNLNDADSIPSTIKYIMRIHELKLYSYPADKVLREEIDADITSMTEFQQIFAQNKISSSNITTCTRLAGVYLHLKSIIP